MKKIVKSMVFIGAGLLSFCASAHNIKEPYGFVSKQTICEVFPTYCNVLPDGDGFGSRMPKDPPKK